MKKKKRLASDFDYESVKLVMIEIAAEGDRAAVILAAAKLDMILEQALKQLLIPPTSNVDDLFEGDAPLNTFHAKTHLAYRIGLIDTHFAHALHLIRRLRNAFAHELSSSSLSNGAHRDRVREIVAPFRTYQILETFLSHSPNREPVPSPSALFRAAVGIMMVRLEQAYHTRRSLNEMKPMALISVS